MKATDVCAKYWQGVLVLVSAIAIAGTVLWRSVPSRPACAPGTVVVEERKRIEIDVEVTAREYRIVTGGNIGKSVPGALAPYYNRFGFGHPVLELGDPCDAR